MNRRHIYVWCEYQRSHHILVYLWLKINALLTAFAFLDCDERISRVQIKAVYFVDYLVW